MRIQAIPNRCKSCLYRKPFDGVSILDEDSGDSEHSRARSWDTCLAVVSILDEDSGDSENDIARSLAWAEARFNPR